MLGRSAGTDSGIELEPSRVLQRKSIKEKISALGWSGIVNISQRIATRLRRREATVRNPFGLQPFDLAMPTARQP